MLPSSGAETPLKRESPAALPTTRGKGEPGVAVAGRPPAACCTSSDSEGAARVRLSGTAPEEAALELDLLAARERRFAPRARHLPVALMAKTKMPRDTNTKAAVKRSSTAVEKGVKSLGEDRR